MFYPPRWAALITFIFEDDSFFSEPDALLVSSIFSGRSCELCCSAGSVIVSEFESAVLFAVSPMPELPDCLSDQNKNYRFGRVCF